MSRATINDGRPQTTITTEASHQYNLYVNHINKSMTATPANHFLNNIGFIYNTLQERDAYKYKSQNEMLLLESVESNNINEVIRL